MAISTELMVNNMKNNGLTHNAINFKKRKVMDYFYRNLVISGILIDFNGFCVTDCRALRQKSFIFLLHSDCSFLLRNNIMTNPTSSLIKEIQL